MTNTRDTGKVPLRLKGALRLISSQCQSPVPVHGFDSTILKTTQQTLRNRRRLRTEARPHLETFPFEHLANLHRYVCFFVIQGNASNFYSTHSLSLRTRLAEDYHDVMTTFAISLNDESETQDDLFCQGTGFATLQPSPVSVALLNITQVPALIVMDTSTGQRISNDAMLAMEWNDPHSVINSWQRGKSGLTCTQTILAMASLQSDCVIM